MDAAGTGSRAGVVVLAIALAAAAGGAALALRGGRSPAEPAPPPVRRGAADASTEAAVTAPVAAPVEAPEAALPEPAPAEQPSRRGDRAPARTATWIDGRVILSPDVPADEEVAVLAWVDGDEQRVAVRPDGSFALDCAPASRRANLRLASRYQLTRTATTRVRLRPGRNEVRIRPELGARLTARLELPVGFEDLAEELARARVRLVPADGESRLARDLRPGPGLAVDSGPIAAGSWLVELQSPWTLPARVGPLELVAGRTTAVVLPVDCGVRLSGTVTNVLGEPLASARVRAVTADPDGDEADRLVRTDGEGRFDFAGVPPGLVRLEVEHRAALARTVDLGRAEGSVHFADLDVALAAGNRVTGVVRFPDGRPVWGAAVRALPVRGGREAESRRTKTDRDGAFELVGVPSGAVVVRADYVRGASSSAAADGRVGTFRAEVETPSGARGLVLVLVRAEDLVGIAVAAGGAPVENLRLTLERRRPDGTWRVERTRTFAGGAFRVSALEPGRWRVHARAAGGRTGSLALDVPGLPDRVELVLAPRAAAR